MSIKYDDSSCHEGYLSKAVILCQRKTNVAAKYFHCSANSIDELNSGYVVYINMCEECLVLSTVSCFFPAHNMHDAKLSCCDCLYALSLL